MPADRLLLARHGRTDHNLRRIVQGPRIDPPLDEVGREQAQRLAGRVAGTGLSAVWASPLARSLETAEPAARRHDAPLYVDARLVEIDWGDWNGRRKDGALLRALGDLAHRWTEGDLDARPPDGESAAEVLARVRATVEAALQGAPGGSVLLVGHGRVNKILLSWLVHGDLRHQETFAAVNCGLSVLERAGARWRPTKLDCRAHLTPTAPAPPAVVPAAEG